MSYAGAESIAAQYPQYADAITAGAKTAFLAGDQWAYIAGIIAVLLGAALVFLRFPAPRRGARACSPRTTPPMPAMRRREPSPRRCSSGAARHRECLPMDAELLSRIQFALTASFHFIFPPISMGLGLMLVVMGIVYLRTKDPKWRQLSFFWVKIYGLVFAMGVATGVVQEFEFGMNWADYSRFVGNVFGSLLAAEGVFAFFLEGGFLGLMLFGGNRLGPRLWLFSIFMVVFGAHFSALWILMANSWMQTPAGLHDRDRPGPGPRGHDRLLGGRLHALVHPPPPARLRGARGRSARRSCSASAPGTCCEKRHVDLAKCQPHAGAAVLHRVRVLATCSSSVPTRPSR